MMFWSKRDKINLKKAENLAKRVMELEEIMSEMSDDDLRSQTKQFKNRLDNGASLDDILVEAFAVCREAAHRVLGMNPYFVQVVGGIILHYGQIAEMRTGEGKTLVATMPAYLNALTGNGVHIVTTNDYLAKRDAEVMGRVYKFLGLTVGLVIHEVDPQSRQKMYAADITYGTNNEFGFDYLRDNMAMMKEQCVQRGHTYVIIDEVDSILIDEARTPLIISGKGIDSSNLYEVVDKFVKSLTHKKVKEFDKNATVEDDTVDCIIEEKGKRFILTHHGMKRAEAVLGISDSEKLENSYIQHYINQSIRANFIMVKDIDYIIKDGEVVIVDEFTGRLMDGRRYNDGLHQSIEAKEGVEIKSESNTLASVTFQNYFRLYSKLSGMTGTAVTDVAEFREIYGLSVVCIPTNKPVIRVDHKDYVFATEEDKFQAIVLQVMECNKKGQPVLIGTTSVEKSEALSAILNRHHIYHNVLNAKNHEKEAAIIAQAGCPGAVTVATNMAGRGTDIILGGNADFMAAEQLKKQGFPEELIPLAMGECDAKDESVYEVQAVYRSLRDVISVDIKKNAEFVRNAGGLFVIGTERHESRRVDNQLRGRAGRQGDPGESRFYLSLEDYLLRIFIPENIAKMNMDTEERIDSILLNRAVISAQKRMEGQNFEARKNVLKYDDVLNQQRLDIYGIRHMILEDNHVIEFFEKAIYAVVSAQIEKVFASKFRVFDDRVLHLIEERLKDITGTEIFLKTNSWIDLRVNKSKMNAALKKEMLMHFSEAATMRYHALMLKLEDKRDQILGMILLRTIDYFWMKHICQMERLKDGIGLQSYGQYDPIVTYKERSYNIYNDMMNNILMSAIYSVYHFKENNLSSTEG